MVLVSSKLKRELKAKDASLVLKNEIKGSQLRVKAAKYGHKIEDIAPPYSDAFYLPDKSNYFNSYKTNNQQQQQQASRNESLKQKNNLNTSLTIVDDTNHSIINQSNNDISSAFITEANNFMHLQTGQDSNSPQKVFKPQLIQRNTSYAQNQTVQDYLRQKTGLSARNGGSATERSNPSERALAAKIHKTYAKPELHKRLRANLSTAIGQSRAGARVLMNS